MPSSLSRLCLSPRLSLSLFRSYSSLSVPSSFRSYQLTSFPTDSSISPDLSTPLDHYLSLHTTLNHSTPLSPPRSHELLIRVHSVALNPLDLFYIRGYGRSLIPFINPPPLTLGRDAAGEVVAVGSGVLDLQVGDRVWVSRNPLHSGTFAEYSTIERRECSKLPDNISYQHAAAYPFALTTAWTALVETGRVQPRELPRPWENPLKIPPIKPIIPVKGKPIGVMSKEEADFCRSLTESRPPAPLPGLGQSALIHGAAGPVGLASVQLLLSWGWNVTATCQGDLQVDHIRTRIAQLKTEPFAGELKIIDTTRPNPPNGEEITPESNFSLERAFPAAEFDLILDGVGGEEAASMGSRALKEGGKLVTLRGNLIKSCDELGVIRGIPTAIAELMEKNREYVKKHGLYLWGINQPQLDALEYAKSLVERGELSIPVDPASEHRFRGLESIPDALKYYEQEKPSGKVIVTLI